MATIRDVVTRALRRIGIVGNLTTPSAEDASAALAIYNDMIAMWPTNGVNVLPVEVSLSDTLALFIPPKLLGSDTMEVLSYAGTWDASANSPALSGGTGTEGTVYRVSVAGTTSLDGIATWSVGDYAVLGKSESATLDPSLTWQKGLSVDRHRAGIIALLAERLCDDYGIDPPANVKEDADSAWRSLLSDFVKTPTAAFDPALTRLPSRRWPYSVPSST